MKHACIWVLIVFVCARLRVASASASLTENNPSLPRLHLLFGAAALQDQASRKRMNAETRASLAVAAGFEAAHYLNAQKIRTRIEAHFRCGQAAGKTPQPLTGAPACRYAWRALLLSLLSALLHQAMCGPALCRRAFEHCDVIITPTLPCTAPPIKPAALVAGESGARLGTG